MQLSLSTIVPFGQKPASNWECKWENEFAYAVAWENQLTSMSAISHL